MVSALLVAQSYPLAYDLLLRVLAVAIGAIQLTVGLIYPSENAVTLAPTEKPRSRWVPILALFFLLSLAPILAASYYIDVRTTQQIMFVLGGMIMGTALHFFSVADNIRNNGLQQRTEGNWKALMEIADKTTMSAGCIAVGGGLFVVTGILFGFALQVEFSAYMWFLKMVVMLLGGSFFLYGSCQAAMFSPWYMLCEGNQKTPERIQTVPQQRTTVETLIARFR